MCPQHIKLSETFTYLKNESIALGRGPDSVRYQAKAIYECGKVIPRQVAIERRRKQLGLPKVVDPDIKEIQTLLRGLGIDKKVGIETLKLD